MLNARTGTIMIRICLLFVFESPGLAFIVWNINKFDCVSNKISHKLTLTKFCPILKRHILTFFQSTSIIADELVSRGYLSKYIVLNAISKTEELLTKRILTM